tara:strand:+ start:297 stop:740 length:444 start_codon:yes stop_codon:yes gene_type:complete
MSQYDAKKLESAITKAFLVFLSIVFMLFCYACSPYYYQSKGPKVTHVLALTEEGDTLKIPIKDIKPNVIYNVVGYDWYRPYSGYYTRWAEPYYHPRLYNPPKPIYNGNSSYNNNNNNNTPNITTPTIKPGGSGINPPPPPINPRKNN